MADRLKGRVVIVTGGGRGIGRATAELFAREGASVVVATRTAAPGQEAVDAITAAGGTATLIATDVGTRQAVSDLIAQTIARFGKIDVILHNAAAFGASSIADLKDSELEEILAVNLKAAFWFAAEGLPHLRKSDAGRLLLTSSITGNRQAYPGYAAYGTSKAGLNGFIRQAGFEFASMGVTVNGVEPGVTFTEGALATLSEEQRAAFAAIIPRGQAGSSEDVAQALLFLASPESAHITGQTIVVDGGQSIGAATPF
ncbi:SDR family NAD(P)-dependent oxidoreductase [Sphingobium phenoxybenzoativorans]|uniref:SDR family NAD(P)-dependent oxidoreductase n=1 Tax=Sphingobium phenoxybenzoativorans TaxID=1592790 RepID=UPI00087286D5|nr:SDR family oxidoreductase [Sphingobium phenoxybenzoativorans]